MAMNAIEGKVNPLMIRWPIPTSELCGMKLSELAKLLDEAVEERKSQSDEMFAIIDKLGGRYESALKDGFLQFIQANEWLKVLNLAYVFVETRDARE